MVDRHEKTHGGYGPTLKEWDEEIIPDLEEKAWSEAGRFVKGIDNAAAQSNDANKVYSYTGKQHRFMRMSVKAIWAILDQYMAAYSKAGEFRAKRLEALEDRVEALDGIAVAKTLDFEAYGAMTEMAERVEMLEATIKQIADGAVRFRGYWHHGEVAQKGDAFSHNGSTYRANCDTETEPGTAGGAWTTIARGASTQKGSR